MGENIYQNPRTNYVHPAVAESMEGSQVGDLSGPSEIPPDEIDLSPHSLHGANMNEEWSNLKRSDLVIYNVCSPEYALNRMGIDDHGGIILLFMKMLRHGNKSSETSVVLKAFEYTANELEHLVDGARLGQVLVLRDRDPTIFKALGLTFTLASLVAKFSTRGFNPFFNLARDKQFTHELTKLLQALKRAQSTCICREGVRSPLAHEEYFQRY